jgi:hypothetical protein
MPDESKKTQLRVHVNAEGTAEPVKIELPVQLVPVFYIIGPGGEPKRVHTAIGYVTEIEKRE